MTHTALHRLVSPGAVKTGGRLRHCAKGWTLTNAHASVALAATPGCALDGLRDDALVRLDAIWDGQILHVTTLELIHSPPFAASSTLTTPAPGALSHSEAARARAALNTTARRFFAERDFLEVETPAWVESPGTDIYLNPFEADFNLDPGTAPPTLRGYLHTSPEFAMKRLLSEGFERIYQLTHVWRNGEVTALHNPEFTILEWYRAWQEVDEIIDDVEALVRRVLERSAHTLADAPFARRTMQEVFEAACGIDLLEALDFDTLHRAASARGLLSRRTHTSRRWDELFFELVVSHLDPYLATLGPIFVTDWPTELAVLARKNAHDPRTAERFELYIGGLELANGFGELTDPTEQRARFEADLIERQTLGLPTLPMPEKFLDALTHGMPPSAGVALGVDRLLMLATGAKTISEVAPFALERDEATGQIRWR
ncbi:MAG: EF-P lysine aminoacylase GenX [Bradymonadaceae bacterium]|nr:EF-P lysine aminoacylase GenX [Lujinxingiaceae bacterium]